MSHKLLTSGKIIASPIVAFFLVLCCDAAYPQNNSPADSLTRLLDITRSDTAKISILNNLSEVLWRKGDYINSKLYAEQVIDLATKLQSKPEYYLISKIGLENAYTNIGSIFNQKFEYDSALQSYSKALQIGEQLHKQYPNDFRNKRSLAITYNFVGGVNYFKGNYDQALSFYFKTLTLFEDLDDKLKIASTLNNIGLVLEEKKDFDKAEEFFFKALKINEKIMNKRLLAGTYNNIGNVLSEKMEDDSALVYYLKAAAVNKETGHKNWLAFNYVNIGKIYTEKKEFEKALGFLLQSLEIRKELGELRGIAGSYTGIGDLYFKKGNFAEAKKNLLISLQITQDISAKPGLMDAYLALAKCDSAMGNYKSAFEYHQLYSQIKDSVFNEESSKQMAEVQTKYETEKKENQNKLLLKENKISTLEIGRQKTRKNYIIIAFSVVLLLGLFLFNRTRLISKNKMLEEKDLRNKAVLMAQEEEKGRLSKELHDGLGPLLSLIKLNASGVSTNSENEKIITEIKHLASEGMKEVRTISHALMPSLLQKNGLKAALEEFTEKITNTGVLNAELNYKILPKLSNETEVNLYRIIQEAVNNSIKYSEATNVSIDLNASDSKLKLKIEDNGKGFDPEKVKKGNGMNNILSRVEILKGNLEVKTKPGSGVKIVISIPLNQTVDA
jgi:two-component system, NarL family, sensor kinase